MRITAKTIEASHGYQTIARWFENREWKIADFQRSAWIHYLKERSGLICSPTGSGKTLAMIGGPLIRELNSRRQSPSRKPKVIWVTPLRALATDTTAFIRSLVSDLGIEWEIVQRTGDSTSRERRLAKSGRADILVITPESLALLLTYPDAPAVFSQLNTVIVDEWHDLVGNKRGVLLQLTLSRIRSIVKDVQIWGMSATIGNDKVAMDALLHHTDKRVLVEVRARRPVNITTMLPFSPGRLPWAGHLGLSQLDKVYDRIMSASTTLVFTNTRAHAELWYKALHSIWREDLSEIALHHGSLDQSQRQAAEVGLKRGTVRCVVTTSSLDLGVDFPTVEQVIQIGSPKGIARLIQRAGRSRHRPGESGQIFCIASQALDLLEYTAARRALKNGKTETRTPPLNCSDVLAQHCVSIALCEGLNPDSVLNEVRSAYSYQSITREHFNEVISFLTHGGKALEQYPDYQRLIADTNNTSDLRYIVPGRRLAARHRMSIGTIASDGAMSVKLIRGSYLGSVEESFISRLNPRDRFFFAGRTLELVRVEKMIAYVRLSKARQGAIPRWQGGRMPLSNTLARETRDVLQQITDNNPQVLRQEEIKALWPLLELQQVQSKLPNRDQLLVEVATTRRGFHLFIYPFAGRAAHEGMASLFAYRWGRVMSNTFSYSMNDYGIMLTLDVRPPAITVELISTLISPLNAATDVRESVNITELSRRHFREIARISGLIAPTLPGQLARTMRQMQASSGLIYDVFRRYDPDHLLLKQADAEVMEYELEFPRILESLEELSNTRIVIVDISRLTPFSFSLWAEGLRGQFSNEEWKTRVERASKKLEVAYTSAR